MLLAGGFYLLFSLSPTTRESDPFFQAIYWLDQIGRDLAPALFLYFALTFPKPKAELEEARRPFLAAVFGPGTAPTVSASASREHSESSTPGSGSSSSTSP